MTIWIYGLRAFCHTFIDSLIKLNKLAPLAGPMGNRNRERSGTRSPESVGLKPMLMRRGSVKSYPIQNSGKELAHGLTKRHPTWNLNTLGEMALIQARPTSGTWRQKAHVTWMNIREGTRSMVSQLIGNVWEWVDSQYSPSIADRIQFEDFPVHSEVRGGAFDTYFPAHATCHFRTGHPLTRRSENLGFRCCLPASNLVEEPEANYDTPKEMRNDC